MSCNDRVMTTAADSRSALDSNRAREWLPVGPQRRESAIRDAIANLAGADTANLVERLIERNRQIHEVECVNLNPATNVMNPRAEAALSAGLGSRPSLGHAGRQVRDGARGDRGDRGDRRRSGVPGVRRTVRRDPGRLRSARQPVRLHGHVPARRLDHRSAGHDRRARHPPSSAAPPGSTAWRSTSARSTPSASPSISTGLAELAERVRPKLITIGASLNLLPHPVAEVRGDRRRGRALRCCSTPLTRAACSPAGVWPNPLDQGADLMTMSTYKSLGGPAGGLVLTNRRRPRRADRRHRLPRVSPPTSMPARPLRWRSRCSTGWMAGTSTRSR